MNSDILRNSASISTKNIYGRIKLDGILSVEQDDAVFISGNKPVPIDGSRSGQAGYDRGV